jgi:hypothetical protein
MRHWLLKAQKAQKTKSKYFQAAIQEISKNLFLLFLPANTFNSILYIVGLH